MRMRGRVLTFGVACIAVALAVWIAGDDLKWPARAWLAFLCGPFPALMLAQSVSVGETIHKAGRAAVYVSSSLTLWMLAFLTFLAARLSGFGFGVLGVTFIEPLRLALWSGGITVAALLFVLLGRALGATESPLVHELSPETRRERMLFMLLCISAGVCEEFVFRGFFLAAGVAISGAIWPTAVAAALLFGALHAYQRAWGAVRAAALGLLLAVPVVLAGTLLPSIIAHTLVDWLAGTNLRRWLVRARSA